MKHLLNLGTLLFLKIVFFSSTIFAQTYTVQSTNPLGANIRTSNNSNATVITGLNYNQHLVSTGVFSNWYYVSVPHPVTATYGYCASSLASGNMVNSSGPYIKVQNVSSIPITVSPGGSTYVTISGSIAKVWNNQYFALKSFPQTINGQTYYEIYLTTNCSHSSGWVTNSGSNHILHIPCNPVVISSHPQNQLNVPIGSSVSFSVSLNTSCTPPFTFKWYKNGSIFVQLANVNSYTNNIIINPVNSSNNGNQYYCEVTGCSGNSIQISNVASLGVCSPPTSPSTAYANGSSGSETIYANQPLILTKSGGNLNNGSNPEWVWYDGTCGANSIGSSNASDAEIIIPPDLLLPDNYVFRVRGETDNCGNSPSCASVSVTVLPPCSTVSVQTLSSPVMNQTTGDNIDLEFQLSGSPPFTYVLLKDGSQIGSGSTFGFLVSYPLNNLNPNQSGTYQLIAENCNGLGSQPSSTIQLVVANCTNWAGNPPSNLTFPNYETQYEYLCLQNIVPDGYGQSNAAYQPSDAVSRKTLAVLLWRSLNGNKSYASNFPVPFLDIDNVSEAEAIRLMLYLDYGDNISPFSREYFNIQPTFTFDNTGKPNSSTVLGIRGAGLRAIFEAFNIQPDWSGYNPTSHSSSLIATNIYLDNPYYGYYKRAKSLGWISTILVGNQQQIDENNLTFADVINAIYKVKHDGVPASMPTIQVADYFIPNNFTISNSSAQADISRGCFSNYSEDGILINRGGFSPEFKPIYNSHLFEIPKTGLWLDDSLKFYQETAYPLGHGWTHSLNAYIVIGLSSNTPSNNHYLVNWPDGRLHVVDYATNAYITNGVNDVFSFQPGTGNIVITTIEKTKYVFQKVADLPNLYRLIEIKDRNNNALKLNYDINVKGWALKGIKDLYSGDSIQVFCGANSRLIDSVKFSNKKLSFIRNTDYNNLQSYGDLIKYFNSKGDSTVYTYSTAPALIHLITNIKLPKGNVINNQYDARRKLSQSVVGNYVTNITFNTNYSTTGNSTQSVINQTGNGGNVTTNVIHNSNGVPSSVTTTSSNISRIGTVYHTQSNNTNSPVMVLDSNTNIKHEYEYNSKGIMTKHVISHSPSGISMTETWTINSSHDLWETYTDMNGVVTSRTFDVNGNVTTISNTAGGLVNGGISSASTYNMQGQPLSSTDGYTTINYGYFSSTGLLNSVSIPSLNISSTASYDQYGRLTKTINPNGVKDSSEYDLNDNVTKTIRDVGGLNLITSNTYDANDNVLSITAPKGDQTLFSYDSIHDYQTQIHYGNFNQVMTYNNDGSLAKLKNKNGHEINYSYYPNTDARSGMLLSDGYKTVNINTTTKWVDSITNASNNRIGYTYDSIGRTKAIEYNDVSNNKVQYEYENLRLKKIIYPFGLGEQTMVYDNASGLLQFIKWNGVTYAEFKYRGDKNLTEEIYFSKIHKLYYYDNAARLDSVVFKKQNGTKLAGFKIQKDAVGNLIYDSAYVNYHNPAVLSYWFGGVNTRSYDNMNRCISYNDSSNTYNGNGCLETFGALGSSYTYDQQDNMLSRTLGGNTVIMTVDPLENRRTYGNTRYFLDLLNNENVLAEKNITTNQFTDIYLYGFTKFCRIDPLTQAPSFYLTDYRGSVIAIVDGNENISHYYYYQNGVQGKLDSSFVSSTIGFPNTTLFVGAHGVITHDSSLVYMRARYYNPMIGNFYSEDPVWSTNLYSYANSNSGYIDPNGESLLLLALGTGAAIGAGLEITDYLLSTKRSEITFKGLLLATAKGGTTGAASVINPLFGKAVGATWDGNEYAKNSVGIKQFAGNFATGFSQSFALSYIGGNSGSMNNTANFLVKKMNVNSPVTKYVAKKIIKGINDKIIDEVKGNMFNKIRRTTIKYY